MQIMDSFLLYTMQMSATSLTDELGIKKQQEQEQKGVSSFDEMLTQRQKEKNTVVDAPQKQVTPENSETDAESIDALQQELMAALTMQPQIPVQLYTVQDAEILPEAEIAVACLPEIQDVFSEHPEQPAVELEQCPVEEIPVENLHTPHVEVQAEEKTLAEPKATVEIAEGLESSQPQMQLSAETNHDNSAQFNKKRDTMQGLDDVTAAYAPQSQETRLFEAAEPGMVKVAQPPVADTESPMFDTQLTDQLELTLEQGMRRVEIRLTPENLGTVVAEFTQTADGSLRVVLQASSTRAAGILSEHAANLGLLMRENTQNEVQIEVRSAEQSQESQYQDRENREGNRQQQPQQQTKRQGQDFLDQLRLGVVQFDVQAS